MISRHPPLEITTFGPGSGTGWCCGLGVEYEPSGQEAQLIFTLLVMKVFVWWRRP